MTVQRLSAQSVKVQLSAEELHVFLPEEIRTPDSPQMLRLISFMLAKAELASGIAFSSLPVTVELLIPQEGGLVVYFTVSEEQPQKKNPPVRQSGIIRLAAKFTERDALRQCCTLLDKEAASIRSSILFRYKNHWILTLKLKRDHASAIHHILLEHGKPYRLSALNRARLNEYGTCIYEQDAVRKALQSGK